jgi:hypothetical protein
LLSDTGNNLCIQVDNYRSYDRFDIEPSYVHLSVKTSCCYDRMLLVARPSLYGKSDNYEKSCRLHGLDLSLPESSLSDTGNNRCTQVDNYHSCDRFDIEPLYVCPLKQILLCYDQMLLVARPSLYGKSDNYEKSCRSHGLDLSLPESWLSDTDNNRCTQVDNYRSCDNPGIAACYVFQ